MFGATILYKYHEPGPGQKDKLIFKRNALLLKTWHKGILDGNLEIGAHARRHQGQFGFLKKCYSVKNMVYRHIR